MKQRSFFTLLALAVILALMLILPGGGSAADPTAAGTTRLAPEEALRQAWERARDAGSYRFLSTADQTLIPRPIPEMIGQRDLRLTLENDGAVLLPDRALVEMRVMGSGEERSVTLLRDGGRAFMVQDGEVRPVEDALSLAGPSNDVLGYLAAAEQVTQLPAPEGHPNVTRYGFQISGARFEETVRRQAEAELASEPGAPEGLRLQASPALQKIHGQGELWINPDGLPIRQVLDIEMPEASANYATRVHMVVDLSAYGRVEALPRAVQDASGAWRLEGDLSVGVGASGMKREEATVGAAAPSAPEGSAATAVTPRAAVESTLRDALPLRVSPSSVALFGLAVLALVAWRYLRAGARRSPRRGYALLATILIPVIVLGPLLQAGRIVRFTERTTYAAAERTEGTVELLRALGLAAEAPEAAGAGEPAAPAPAAAGAAPVSLSLTREPAPLVVPQKPLTAHRQPGESASAATRCGGGEVGADTDGDGLSDPVELCYGTSPYNADSDSDGIPDRVELDGFDAGGKHWDSDPLNADSNGDGQLDTLEWAGTHAANGQAASADIDGDGIPNLWDDDDDGDAVPDGLDVSPQMRSDYTASIDLSLDGDASVGYTYLDIQVQPQDAHHLRYSTTALDWPMDDEGNVQDLDHSTDDVRITPFLLVETNVAPEAALADKYGVGFWAADDGGYILLVPLTPVQDGGLVYAFSGRVAYAPGQIIDARWNATMVWMAQMRHDMWIEEPGGAHALASEMHLLHQYQDTFRLIGLHVTVNAGYEAAVFGTPDETDDLDLFTLLLGLHDTFRSHLKLEGQEADESALQEILQRFSTSSTASITQTFGVDRHAISICGPTEYGHADAGLAGVGSYLVPVFLDTYSDFYGNAHCRDAEGNPVNCASLIVAYEQSQGGHDLEDMPSAGSGLVDLSALRVNVSDVPVVTTRGVQMRMYEQGAGGWQMATPARVLELIEQRYKDVYDTALRDFYPDLTVDDVRLMAYSAYLAAISPAYTPVAVDGQTLVPEVADEEALALGRALDARFEGAVETVIDWVAYGSGLAQSLVGTGASFLWVGSDFLSLLDEWAKTSGIGNAWSSLGVGLFAAATAASTAMGVINAVCSSHADLAICRNQDALRAANLAVNSLAIVAQAQCALSLIISHVQHSLKAISNAALVAQGVGAVVSISLSWACFAMKVAAGGGDPVVWRVALAEAIVTTIYLVVVFALNFIPIIGQIITAILSLIDMIVALFTGLFGGKTYSVATAILNLFYDASTSTVLAAAEFGAFSTALTIPDVGLVGGNGFEISLPFSGVITKTSDGTTGDLEDSYVEGALQPMPDDFASVDTSLPRNCRVVDGELRCTNTATLRYRLTPRINGIVGFTSRILYRTVWAEYGAYHGWRWATHTEDGALPEPGYEEWSELPLDVIPRDMDDLWRWDALTNADRDGDGLSNAMEAAMGTNPDSPDSDGDGLSDHYEWTMYDDLGTDPLVADTDGDGLDDGFERRVGTKAGVADSDGDGLTDGEEVRRVVAGAMVGGWTVSLSDYGEARVTSSPLRADDDGDRLNGYEERAHHLSPRAVNDLVPTLSMSVAPIRGMPGGRSGLYLRPGDLVTIALQVGNVATDPVNGALTLYLPGWLGDIAGGVLTGDRTPTPGTVSGAGMHGLGWSFTGADALLTYEFAATTITATVASDATEGAGEIRLKLPYGSMMLERVFPVIVDAQPPDVAVLAPADGAFLSGTRYVVGGAARDATTWLTGVDLSIVPHGSSADLQPLEGGASPWAYTWDLPGDGIYSLEARATDAMGNVQTTVPVSVTVDNTPPAATMTFAMDGGIVRLSGTATDNQSGIARVQLSIDGQPWRSVTVTGEGTTSATWAYDWQVGTDAQGKHGVRMRALDRAGNASVTSTEEVVVDRVAPSSVVNAGAQTGEPPAVRAGVIFTLTGVADEGGHLPPPATAADLRSGMDVFDDASVWLGVSGIRDNDGGVLAAWIGDFDADRLADLAVGLPGPEGDGGQVVVLEGRAGGWPAAPDLEMLAQSRTRFLGVAGARLGSYVAAAGDANGDGMFDLLIGERESTRAFLVFGYPGPLAGVTLDGGEVGLRTLLQAPAAITGLAGASDVNGDGRDDLLVRAGATAYLIMGRGGVWPEVLDVAAEAAATFGGVVGATGIGDVNGDQRAEWVTMSAGQVVVHRWDAAGSTARVLATTGTADAEPRVVAPGDVDGDGLADWVYSSGVNRTLVYGSGATPHTISGYGGLMAAPGDVDGDRRADLLLADAAGVARLIRQQEGETPEVFATIAGVGGAANAPYAAGADLNADGSADVVLIPSAAAAEARGFDTPDFSQGFISPQALPLGASSLTVDGDTGSEGRETGAIGILSAGADTRYVDDDPGCGGYAPCYNTIQAAVNASDVGGDTIIVLPGVHAAFSVPATADGLTVRGVSPDAVFIEGNADGGKPDAVSVAADGVRLVNLTVRNAVAGVALVDGGGEPTVLGGSETTVDHVVAHAVQHPISMTRGSALTIRDSTLVGDGARPIVQVSASSSAHAWANDREVGTPITTTDQPIATGGALLAAGGSLYAVPGGPGGRVYASTPGAGGALGAWSAPFALKHDFWRDAPSDGTSMVTSSGAALYQLHTSAHWAKLGGTMSATMTSPDPVPFPLPVMVNAVAIHPTTGEIYIGGGFTAIGGQNRFRLARWDGESWRKVGSDTDINDNGVDGVVYALEFVPDGVGGYDLHIGGDFDHLNKLDAGVKIPVGNVVRWNGSQWEYLGAPGETTGRPNNGTNGPVFALAHDSYGFVYVGGSFSEVYAEDGQPLPNSNVSRYSTEPSGYDWQVLGQGFNGAVHALVTTGSSSDYVYAGGAFTASGGVAMTGVARIQKVSAGSSWSAVGAGVAGDVVDLARDPVTGHIYGVADSEAAVQRWNGSTWAQVPGVTYPGNLPNCVEVDADGNVYVGASYNGAALYVQRAGTTGLVRVGSEGAASMSSHWIEDLAVDSGGRVYAATDHALSTFDTGTQIHEYESRGGLSRWVVNGLYKRAVPSGSWTRQQYPPTADGWTAPTAMTGDASGNLYAVWGSYTAGRLYRFDAASNAWTSLANPDTTLTLEHLVWASDRLYALGRNAGGAWNLRRYDNATNAWTALAAPPITSGAAGAGLSWTWDGEDHIYLLAGDGTRAYWRYRINANAWETLPDPTPAFTVSHGPAMARIGSYLYVYGTPGGGVTTNLFRYGVLPASDLRLTVRDTAFVVPEAATSFAWTSLSAATGDYAFRTDIDASNAWVGPASASWTPTQPGGAATLTTAQAAFVAPTDGLYRVGAGSALAAGYHEYVAVAHVYPSLDACVGCADGSLTWGKTAFATVREAVESGAARVLVHPGRYPQTFYLVSGVEVIGSGAEATIIEAPAGSAGTLVTAEGVAGATLARVTLAGGAGWQGFLAEGGTRGVTFARNIVRDLSTGVRLRGGSEVTVVNNTIVRNGAGLVAEGTNPVNVRNTIFAYHTGTGLQHGADPTSLSNTYNDFYANGADMSPADPGGGTLYHDPGFRAPAENDLRLAAGALLIDRGSPSDATPPGAGTRVDIGYAEYNAAGFYVSPRYSETGLNDGLTWGIDAFDSIADALDAAAATLAGLPGALPAGGYSVGVDAGTYHERVSAPSHVRLVGSGAEVTTIDAGGVGSAVTFDAVTDAELSGMTLMNASAGRGGVDVINASSGITITRSVIRNNAGHGVRLAGGASAAVDFCTIVDNAGAGVYATGAGTWARVRNSILSGDAYDLQAESNALIRNDYNLLNSTPSLSGVTAGEHTVAGDPAFTATGHYLTAASPALDAADPLAAVPTAGGVRADLGYKELTACPLTLFFGPRIDATVMGNSGVRQVEVGVAPVSDASQPVTATLPTTWQTLTPGAGDEPIYFWRHALSQSTAGLYRVYSRATDAAGNAEQDAGDWYEGAFVIDDTAPTVAWGTPALPTTTSAAAVLAVAAVDGTVSTGMGTRDDVKQVYFHVVGPDGTVDYPANGDRAWIPLPVAGGYTIRAVAVDDAGNTAQTGAVTLTANAGSALVTVSAPADGGAVSGTAVVLRGYARFASSGAGAVSVAVSGGATVQATLEEPGARSSAWWATITLPPGEGTKVVTVTPSLGGVPGTAVTLNLKLDTTAPTLAVSGPAVGATMTRTVAFNGTVSDAGSGVERVDVSLDGGYSWRQADVDGGAWSLDVVMDGPQDAVRYPARVRAADVAGNTALVSRTIVVDSQPPTDLTPATFSAPEGQHVPLGTTLTVGWGAPIDAGGPVQVLLDVDQGATTDPTTEVGGASANVTLDATGDWYAHLAAEDATGNRMVYHYGPWHVRDLANATFAARRQSIVVDGFIDLAHDEWLDGDLLGTDAQGIATQKLYATWDGLAIYLGWSGAWWTLDGTMWAYLDVAPGGTTQTVDGALALPADLGADLAVRIDDPASGALYLWNGGTWALSEDDAALTFAHGSSGDTEARVKHTLAADQSVALVAFALYDDADATMSTLGVERSALGITADEGAQPWVIFPNTNPLGGELDSSFGWDSPSVGLMNDGQPQARTARLSALSPQPPGVARCPGSTLTYAITLENPEPTEITGLTLALSATEGLGFQSVSGAAYTGDVGGASWVLTVPAIAAGARHLVTVTGTLAADLSGLGTVTNTIALSAGETPLTGETSVAIAHRVDGQTPTVVIDAPAGSAIASGVSTFTGTAADGDGSGVARVDVRAEGAASWTEATGTVAWSAVLDVPDGATSFALEARAVDACGRTSEPATWEYAVDDAAPEVSMSVPAVITSTPAFLGGSTSDPHPSGASVARVEAQVDSEGAAWQLAAGLYAPVGGVQGWTWGWAVPHDDGATHQLRARATDGVGNATTTDWSTTIVDVIAPVITVTTPMGSGLLGDGVSKGGGEPPLRVVTVMKGTTAATPALAGSVTDGSGVQAVRVWAYGAQGSQSIEDATLHDGSWEYQPDVATWPIGSYALRVQAIDIYGNAQIYGPYLLEVDEEPIVGLAVTSDGPKRPGETVTLTATVSSGTRLTYTWDYGDGVTGEGEVVGHAYGTAGAYTATVTATNTISEVQASVAVLIEDPVSGLAAHSDSPTALGEATTFTATVASGTNVVYEWAFGDDAMGTGSLVTHTYSAAGTYTAVVTATNGVSQLHDLVEVLVEESVSGLVAVSDSPTALGQATTFTATVASGTNVVYGWAFGDGETGSGSVVSHTYGAAGTYTAVVTATNGVSQLHDLVEVLVEESVSGLVAHSDSPTALGQATTFTATVASGTNVVYEWAFGDGETGSGSVVSHTYGAAGSYTAVVTATNGVSQLQDAVEVRVEESVSGLVAVSDSPTTLGQATTFTATVASGSSVVYDWDFGDGDTGTGSVVPHTYGAAGTYTATVTARNDVSQLQDAVEVLVEESVNELMAVGDSPTALGQATTFTATVASGSSVVYEWDFGDGETDNGDVVSHTYGAAGSYTATVSALNDVSLLQASVAVRVEETVEGLQASSDSPTALGQATTLSATVDAGSNVVYEWDFGDGEIGSGDTVTHAYALAGVYTATVTAANDVSLLQASVMVLVEEAVSGLVADNDGYSILGGDTTLSATVEAGSNVVYDWELGDGETGNGAVVVHQYAAVGEYVAEVAAYNSVSRITATTTVVIKEPGSDDEPIVGLAAHTSAPEAVGVAVELSATISAGSAVVYAWDYGDGETGTGTVVSHAYVAVGTYTATVTATNGTSQREASVTVLIEEPVSGLTAANDGPTILGLATTLSATVEAGSNVVYDWAFGDGATASGMSVTHRYDAAGAYDAEVVAYNSIARITATTTVVVEPGIEPSQPRAVHLPVALRAHRWAPALPDLVVEEIRLDAEGIALTVRNRGRAPVVDSFWVDLYVAPREAPTAVGQIWQDLGEWGMAWGVTGAALPLAEGASLTLRAGDALYAAQYSLMPKSLPAGTEIYAQVDAVASVNTYGAVQESDEMGDGPSNNIAGPVTLSEEMVAPYGALAAGDVDIDERPEMQR